MSKYDKYSQAAVGLLFVLILGFFGLATLNNIRQAAPAELSRATINQQFDAQFARHDDFIDLNGAFLAAIGTDIVRDADPQNIMYKLSNGKLTNIMAVYDMYANANNTIAFYEWLKAHDIDFAYVMAPNKNSDPEAKLPPGVHDYADFCMDIFTKNLDSRIPLIDLRKEFNEAGLDWSSLYFITDHHWLPSTGLWVSSHLLEYFAKRGSITPVEYNMNAENFYTDSYKQSFLGSWGRRVGKYYAGVDDFDFVHPAFETSFEVVINKLYAQSERSGSFMKALVYEPLLIMDEEHLLDNHYGAYFGGDYAEVIVRNKEVENGGKLLLIKDSFSLPVAALMSCAVSELRLLDFRYLTEYDLEAYIEDYQPDAVIVMYSPSVLGANFMYKFLNESKQSE